MPQYNYPCYKPTTDNWLTARPGTKFGYHGGNDNAAPATKASPLSCDRPHGIATNPIIQELIDLIEPRESGRCASPMREFAVHKRGAR
jgi:hypothetical protein